MSNSQAIQMVNRIQRSDSMINYLSYFVSKHTTQDNQNLQQNQTIINSYQNNNSQILFTMSALTQFDYLLKIVVIGDSGVGKTNLLSRFSSNEFSHQSKPTIGVQFATRSLQINNSKIKAQIWDTAGQQRFRAITHAYYKGATGALLVFDITRRSSYDNLSKWLKQLKQNADENIVCILVGNKSDLAQNRCVKQQQIAQFAQENKLFYLETSALQSTNVQKAFMTVIKQIYDNMTRKQGNSSSTPSGTGYNNNNYNTSPTKTSNNNNNIIRDQQRNNTNNNVKLKNQNQGNNDKLSDKKKKNKCCQ